MAIDFRGLFKSLLPGRFTTDEGEKVVWSLALIKDAYMTRMRAGHEAKMPTRTGASGLQLIGEDRGIPRGRTEAAAHYAQRLLGWRTPRGHRVRGSAFALLDQVGEYFGGIRSWTIDVKMNRHLRTADGALSFSYAWPWNWDDVTTLNLARFWVVIEPVPEVPGIKAWPTFDAPFSTPGAGIGQQGLGPADADAIRGLFKGLHPWAPSGSRAEWLIVNLDNTTQTPDGTWLHWSKLVAGARVPTRYAGWRYISLNDFNNAYAGNPASFGLEFTLIDTVATYAGDPASFSASIDLPDGSTYVGNPGSFPTTIHLIDDGDLP